VRSSGDRYEELAAELLTRHNLRIVARNWSCKAGEIDIVARDDTHLVFVEVRARARSRFASAAATVDRRKQQRLLRAARWFLQQHRGYCRLPCRFDVVAFDVTAQDGAAPPRAQWIRGAFTA